MFDTCCFYLLVCVNQKAKSEETGELKKYDFAQIMSKNLSFLFENETLWNKNLLIIKSGDNIGCAVFE